MKRTAPAAGRNCGPILDVLRAVLPTRARVLEIASGSGEHAIYFARHLPGVSWQPSDADPDALASIEAWRAEEGSNNLAPPIALDASADRWDAPLVDAVVCINMIHIAPWSACLGLFRGAELHVEPGGLLILYGPFRFAGSFTAPSNLAFDESLRARDAAWGVRDVDDIRALAESRGMSEERVVAMPANNHVVVFRRSTDATGRARTGPVVPAGDPSD